MPFLTISLRGGKRHFSAVLLKIKWVGGEKGVIDMGSVRFQARG